VKYVIHHGQLVAPAGLRPRQHHVKAERAAGRSEEMLQSRLAGARVREPGGSETGRVERPWDAS
jgi:hypothetical protein